MEKFKKICPVNSKKIYIGGEGQDVLNIPNYALDLSSYTNLILLEVNVLRENGWTGSSTKLRDLKY